MFSSRPLSTRVNPQPTMQTTANFSSTVYTQPSMINSRVIDTAYTVQSPIIMKQQTHFVEPSISGLVRNDTKATISSSPSIFIEPLKVQNIEVVRPFLRRQNIQIRSGNCQRVSNICCSPGSGCLKCIAKWLLILFGLLLLSAIIFGIMKLFLLHSHECRAGFHFINGKCYGCPEGSDWDGQNCIKDDHIIKVGEQSQINPGERFNQQTPYTNKNRYVSNPNNPQTIESNNVHHLRYYM